MIVDLNITEYIRSLMKEEKNDLSHIESEARVNHVPIVKPETKDCLLYTSPHAISASEENFEVNHISKDQFEVYQGNVLDDKEFAASLGSKCYPVVVANILADVISPLIEIVDQFLAEDGVFVISGIIDTKEKEIADKLNAYGFDVIELSLIHI